MSQEQWSQRSYGQCRRQKERHRHRYTTGMMGGRARKAAPPQSVGGRTGLPAAARKVEHGNAEVQRTTDPANAPNSGYWLAWSSGFAADSTASDKSRWKPEPPLTQCRQ